VLQPLAKLNNINYQLSIINYKITL